MLTPLALGAMLFTLAAPPEPEAGPLDDVPVETLRALDTYRLNRLHRAPLQASPTGSEFAVVLSWAPFDGGGAPLATAEFATRVGDDAMLERLVKERRRIDAGLAVGIVVGGSLAGVGAALVGQAAAQPGPDIRDFPTDDGEGFDLLAFQSAEAAHADAVRPRIVLGSLLLAGGIDAVFLSFVPWDRGKRRQQYAYEYYSTEEADRRIDEHNDGLRRHLGLSEEDARRLDLIEGVRSESRPPATGFRIGPLLGPVFGIAGRF